jgi:hypothetical protein
MSPYIPLNPYTNPTLTFNPPFLTLISILIYIMNSGLLGMCIYRLTPTLTLPYLQPYLTFNPPIFTLISIYIIPSGLLEICTYHFYPYDNSLTSNPLSLSSYYTPILSLITVLIYILISGLLGICWKASRIGERTCPYIPLLPLC